MNADLDFEKMGGLLPAVVQAMERTLKEGYVTFFSRTRNQLWTKGESSGNRLRVVSAHTDCDRDTLLLRVTVEGAGLVCHRGTRSCFTDPVPVQTAPATTVAASPEER
jgi:phosphoribosyl-AMP cyclohydrolase